MRAFILAALALFVVGCKSTADVPVAATPIQAVLAQGKDDQRVVVRGQVTQKLSSERFVIADRTGSIRVHIDDDAVRRQGIGVGSQVEVAAEVDTNGLRETTLKAERVVVLVPSTGGARPAY